MPYKFQPGMMYRMPTHFGPSLGPRQGPDGRKFECRDNPKTTSLAVNFLTNREQLEELIPEVFQLEGEPVVTVEASYMTEIEWLAGRGYNTLGVKFPVAFKGERDSVVGSFLTVLWENLTDPILTGREDIGFSKIYCELPEPRFYGGEAHSSASWLGFKLMDLRLKNLKELTTEEIKETGSKQMGDGTLHYKYMPRTEEWGRADAAYAVLTPSETPNKVIKEMWRGEGVVQFHRAAWEDLPTMYTIVNAFADLEVKEYRGASLTRTVGGKDLGDQRILR